MSRLEEVLEELLAQLLVRRRDAQHLLEGNQRVGRVVGLLVQRGERRPHRQTEGVALGRCLEVLLDLLLGSLLVRGDEREAILGETMVRHRLDRLVGRFDGFVRLGFPLVDAGLRVG